MPKKIRKTESLKKHSSWSEGSNISEGNSNTTIAEIKSEDLRIQVKQHFTKKSGANPYKFSALIFCINRGFSCSQINKDQEF